MAREKQRPAPVVVIPAPSVGGVVVIDTAQANKDGGGVTVVKPGN